MRIDTMIGPVRVSSRLTCCSQAAYEDSDTRTQVDERRRKRAGKRQKTWGARLFMMGCLEKLVAVVVAVGSSFCFARLLGDARENLRKGP
jgi:hypothetical protein